LTRWAAISRRAKSSLAPSRRPPGTSLILVGPEARVREELARHGETANLPIAIADADEAVAMDERRSRRCAAGRARPCAPRLVPMRARRSSPPATRRGISRGAWRVRHAAGVDRPALAVIVPTRDGAAVLSMPAPTLTARRNSSIGLA
jgi:glycerol-3-phosphate acyltransferase PlsX